MTNDADIIIGIRGDVSGGKVIQRTLDDIDRSGKKAQSGVNDLRAEMGRTNSVAQVLTNTMRGLGAAFLLRELQTMVDTYTNFQNRLKLVTTTSSELIGVTRELFNISNQTRQSFASTAEVYARVALATKDMGLSQRATLDFTKSLSQAVAVSGASATEAGNAMIQLSQGLASGTLRGDELRSVLEQLPAVADVIAKGLGVTRGELRKMGEDGKITAENVIEAFAKARVEIEENFAKTTPTIEQSFTVLKNKLIEAIGDFDKATQSSEMIATSLIKLGDVITIVFSNMTALSEGLKGVFADIAGSILIIVNEIIESIQRVLNAGIDAVNYFKKEKIANVDYGMSSEDILKKQTGISGQHYQNATKALEKSKAAAGSLFGFETKPVNDGGTVSDVGGTPKTGRTALSAEAEKAQKQIDKVTDSLKFQLEQLKRTDVEQAVYNNLRQAGVSIDSVAGKNIAELTRQYEENSKQLEQQKKIVEGVSGAFEGFFKSAITGSDGFRGAIKGLIGSLADLAFQMTVIEPIKQNLFGAISGGGGGIFSSIVGNLFGASISPAVSQAAARGLANPALYGPGFASGGSMTLGGFAGTDQNQLSLNGAPIARVGRGEVLSISPEQKTGAGIVVQQTINLSMGVAEAVAQQFSSFLPQIQKATQSAIEEAQMRGIKA